MQKVIEANTYDLFFYVYVYMIVLAIWT